MKHKNKPVRKPAFCYSCGDELATLRCTDDTCNGATGLCNGCAGPGPVCPFCKGTVVNL